MDISGSLSGNKNKGWEFSLPSVPGFKQNKSFCSWFTQLLLMNLTDSFDLLHHISFLLCPCTGVVQATWRDRREHGRAAKDKSIQLWLEEKSRWWEWDISFWTSSSAPLWKTLPLVLAYNSDVWQNALCRCPGCLGGKEKRTLKLCW